MKASSVFANRWVIGARPRTLAASIVPVVLGTAIAAPDVEVSWWKAVAAVVVALSLQIATNFANDYSDGIRGTDKARVGPMRLVASGLATPEEVKRAAIAAFAVAGVVGIVLSVAVNPLLILVIGVPSLLAGWFYTGGPRPYGYSGFGELFVFVFFGLAATLGSQYVQSQEVTSLGLAAALCSGSFAVALLVVNNLRDIETDAEAGKRTLAVRTGGQSTRNFLIGLLLYPAVFVLILASSQLWFALSLLYLVAALPALIAIGKGAAGRKLLPVLSATGRAHMIFGITFAVAVQF
jgi:1,4-dihydroxy-2-naphthoate polyprenyltransferase